MRLRCTACRNSQIDFDHRDPSLGKYLTAWGKIRGRKDTKMCAKHQRNLARAIKRARFLALVPYTTR